MTEARKPYDGDRRCKCCEKPFYIPSSMASGYIYRWKNKNGGWDYYCSYSCNRRADTEREAKKQKVGRPPSKPSNRKEYLDFGKEIRA